MLNFGGVDLLIDANGDAAEFINKYIPTDLYQPWRRPSFPGFGTIGLGYPTAMYAEPKFTLNRLHWPCKDISRWSFMHVLCYSDAVQYLLQYVCIGGAYNPLPLKMGNPETDGESLPDIPMYLLPPTPLSGIRGLTGSVNSLYLLTIVDIRYFLWYTNSGDMVSFFGDSTTWTELFNYMIGQAGIDMEFDTIPAAYLNPSKQMYLLPYEPCPPILDSMAFDCGLRITANYDGTFWAQSYASALAAYQADVDGNPDRSVLSGGLRYSSLL